MTREFLNDGALVCKEKDILRRRVPAAPATWPMLGKHQGLDVAEQRWPEGAKRGVTPRDFSFECAWELCVERMEVSRVGGL